MTSLLERRLLVVSGKGGVGKTTLAGAIGLAAADSGLRTIVVEVGEQSRLPDLFGRPARRPGADTELRRGLWSISIDPDRALLEWLQALGGRVSGRILASSSTFQYFAAAAPGAKELVSMVKIWRLAEGGGRAGRAGAYDLVVLDAPATGHALAMLHSPQTFGAIARVGPIAGQAQRVRALLADPRRCGYLAVAHASEMAVTETLELQEGLRRQVGRELDAVIVNGLLPNRFSAAELRRLERLAPAAAGAPGGGRGGEGGRGGGDVRDGGDVRGGGDVQRGGAAPRGGEPRTAKPSELSAADQRLARSAALAARAVHERARLQRNQVARLRRRGLHVVGIPFQFHARLDPDSLARIAAQLQRKL